MQKGNKGHQCFPFFDTIKLGIGAAYKEELVLI
jgi:hypothetical protein